MVTQLNMRLLEGRSRYIRWWRWMQYYWKKRRNTIAWIFPVKQFHLGYGGRAAILQSPDDLIVSCYDPYIGERNNKNLQDQLRLASCLLAIIVIVGLWSMIDSKFSVKIRCIYTETRHTTQLSSRWLNSYEPDSLMGTLIRIGWCCEPSEYIYFKLLLPLYLARKSPHSIDHCIN